MKTRIEAVRRFRSPYAPQVWLYGARLVAHADCLRQRPVYLAGKGMSEDGAMTRLYGEAAERDALFMRTGDEARPLIDATLTHCADVPAHDVLLSDEKPELGSNGCATHNMMERAVHMAIAELIERRAIWLWWERRVPLWRLELSSHLTRVISDARAGAIVPRETRLFAVQDTGPFKVALAHSQTLDETEPAIAFAASLDPDRAAERAFLELLSVELETADLHGARLRKDPVIRESDRGLVAARQEALCGTHRDLLDAPREPVRLKADSETWTLERIIAHYSEAGQDIMLADLTRPDTNLPTCRALFRNADLQPRFPRGYALSPL